MAEIGLDFGDNPWQEKCTIAALGNRVKQEGVKNSSPVGSRHAATITRGVVADNFVIALWRTMIGKKVVMAITGVVLVGFVIAHMVGKLKIFSGSARSTLTHVSSGK